MTEPRIRPQPNPKAMEMAYLVTALKILGPQLVYGRTIELEELAEWTAGRSGLTDEEVERVLVALRSAVIHYCRGGAAVRLPGLGRFRPSIDPAGRIRMRIVPDASLSRALRNPKAYRGEIRNRANMGLSDADLKRLWDAEHPEDPLVLPLRRAG